MTYLDIGSNLYISSIEATGSIGLFENLYKIGMVVQIAGSVDGRKRFQKSIHILKTIGFDFDEQYRWGNYGPYSLTLASEIQTMKEANYLREDRQPGSEMYVYRLTEEGKAFLEHNSVKSEQESFDRAVLVLSKKEVEKLELLSTCLFIWRSEDTADSMVKLVKYLKTKYSLEEIQSCVDVAGMINRANSAQDKISIIEQKL